MPVASCPSFTHDVITIGSAVVDEYATSPLFELERSSGTPSGWNACVPLGAKIPLSSLTLETGGGATNAAATFAHLGFRTAAVCRIGTDLCGEFVMNHLNDARVDTTFVQRDTKNPTGQSIILVSGIGERSILVHRGASGELNPKEIPWTKLAPRWFYVTSLDGDLGLMALILDRAERVGARVAWNPGRHEVEKVLHRLLPLIRRVDVLDVNREEAALLTHKPARHLNEIVRTLSDLPKVAFLLSDGDNGAYLSSHGCTWSCGSLSGKRINTTGAGDALGSGFVAGFLHSCDLSLGFKVGMLNALGVITHMGAKAGILKTWPTERELARVKIKLAKLT